MDAQVLILGVLFGQSARNRAHVGLALFERDPRLQPGHNPEIVAAPRLQFRCRPVRYPDFGS